LSNITKISNCCKRISVPIQKCFGSRFIESGSISSILGSIQIRIKGFEEQITGDKKFIFFLIKKGRSSYFFGEAFSPQGEHPALQNMKLFYIFVGYF
jgi:hypothetical protein